MSSVEIFLKSPSCECLQKLPKDVIVKIGRHYGLDVRPALRRAQLIPIVEEYLKSRDNNITTGSRQLHRISHIRRTT